MERLHGLSREQNTTERMTAGRALQEETVSCTRAKLSTDQSMGDLDLYLQVKQPKNA